MALVICGPLIIDEVYVGQNLTKTVSFGGSALYSAIGASFISSNVTLVSRIGNDYSDEIIHLLSLRGVNTQHLFRDLKKSCGCKIVYQGNQREISYSDGAATLEQASVRRHELSPLLHEQDSLLITPTLAPIQIELMQAALLKKVTVAVDPTEHIPKGDFDTYIQLVNSVNYFAPSEKELFLSSDRIGSVTEYLSQWKGKGLIIKLGPRGCHYAESGLEFQIPAYKNAKIVDETGCGDAFLGAFMAAQLISKDISKSLKMATAVASLCLEQNNSADLLKLSRKETELRLALL